MYYKEYLRARGAFIVFTIVLTVLLAISLLIQFAVTGQGPSVTLDHGSQGIIPWPALLGAAAIVAAIMATCLGSTFANEDGHLETALTKPYSRTEYAATLIAVDMLAIAASQVLTFAFILIPIFLLGFGRLLVSGPDAAANAVRFALFPLAWYAIIIALSASLRGKAGVVQGLIWPVTLGLTALREAPFNSPWHNIFVALNAINPLVYASYESSHVQIVGASPQNVLLSIGILAALIAAGWVAATMQWRRIEA